MLRFVLVAGCKTQQLWEFNGGVSHAFHIQPRAMINASADASASKHQIWMIYRQQLFTCCNLYWLFKLTVDVIWNGLTLLRHTCVTQVVYKTIRIGQAGIHNNNNKFNYHELPKSWSINCVGSTFFNPVCGVATAQQTFGGAPLDANARSPVYLWILVLLWLHDLKTKSVAIFHLCDL